MLPCASGGKKARAYRLHAPVPRNSGHDTGKAPRAPCPQPRCCSSVSGSGLPRSATTKRALPTLCRQRPFLICQISAPRPFSQKGAFAQTRRGLRAGVFVRAARDDDFGVTVAFLNELVHGRKHDAPRPGILDAVHGGGEHGVHVGLLKAEVGVHHLAVHELEIRAVAKRLRTDDAAALQREMIGIPAEELPFQNAVAHRHVLRVPEGVAARDVAVLEGAVVQILKSVLACEAHVCKVEIHRVQHEIIALHRAVAHTEEAKAQAALINLSDFWEQTYSRNRLHKKASSNKKEDGLYAKWLLPELGNIPLCQITPEHLDKLKNEMLIQKKSPRTIQYVLAIFSQVWHLAETRGIVSGIAPTKKVKLPKFDNKKAPFFESGGSTEPSQCAQS